MLNRRSFKWIVVWPAVISIVWTCLDASPSLYLYDLIMTASTLLAGHNQFDSLKEKTIWVTGASSGIGAELVCQLIQAESKHGKLQQQAGHTNWHHHL